MPEGWSGRMNSPSNISLLLRPNVVAEQMAKEARLKRLQQVRDAEKEASKIQRKIYNQRVDNVKKNERSSEKAKWKQEQQARIDNSSAALSKRLLSLGAAHRQASEQAVGLKLKETEHQAEWEAHLLESKVREQEAKLAAKEDPVYRRREMVSMQQRHLKETRKVDDEVSRRNARMNQLRRTQHEKEESLYQAQHYNMKKHIPITRNAESHPRGTRTGGTKLVDFSRTRIHATVTSYPSMDQSSSRENVNPSVNHDAPFFDSPTPRNIANDIIAKEAEKLALRKKQDQKRKFAIETRSHHAEEAVHTARVTAKVQASFKALKDAERHRRIQEARNGVLHHRSAVATVLNLEKTREQEDAEREAVVKTWFKVSKTSAPIVRDVKVNEDAMTEPNDGLHMDSEGSMELLRVQPVNSDVVEDEPTPQPLPAWIAPHHLRVKPEIPVTDWIKSPTPNPPRPPIEVIESVVSQPKWEAVDEDEIVSREHMAARVDEISQKETQAHLDRSTPPSVEHRSIIEHNDRSEEEEDTISLTFHEMSGQMMEGPHTGDRSNSASLIESESPDRQHKVEKEEEEERTPKMVQDEEKGEESEEDKDLSVSNASVSASILQSSDLFSLAQDIDRSKAYLEASHVLARMKGEYQEVVVPKPVVFEYENSSESDGSSSSESFQPEPHRPVSKWANKQDDDEVDDDDDVDEVSSASNPDTTASSQLPHPMAVLEAFRRDRVISSSSESVMASSEKEQELHSFDLSFPRKLSSQEFNAHPTSPVQPLKLDMVSEFSNNELGTDSNQIVHENLSSHSSSETSPSEESHTPRAFHAVETPYTSSDLLENTSHQCREDEEVLIADTSINSHLRPGMDAQDSDSSDDESSLSFGYLSTDEGPVYQHDRVRLPANHSEFGGVDLSSHSSFEEGSFSKITPGAQRIVYGSDDDPSRQQKVAVSFTGMTSSDFPKKNDVGFVDEFLGAKVLSGQPPESTMLSMFEGFSMASSLTLTEVRSMAEMERHEYDIAESLKSDTTHQHVESLSRHRQQRSELGSESSSWSSEDQVFATSSVTKSTLNQEMPLLQQQQLILKQQMERNRQLMEVMDTGEITSETNVNSTHLELSSFHGTSSSSPSSTARANVLGDALNMMAELNLSMEEEAESLVSPDRGTIQGFSFNQEALSNGEDEEKVETSLRMSEPTASLDWTQVHADTTTETSQHDAPLSSSASSSTQEPSIELIVNGNEPCPQEEGTLEDSNELPQPRSSSASFSAPLIGSTDLINFGSSLREEQDTPSRGEEEIDSLFEAIPPPISQISFSSSSSTSSSSSSSSSYSAAPSSSNPPPSVLGKQIGGGQPSESDTEKEGDGELIEGDIGEVEPAESLPNESALISAVDKRACMSSLLGSDNLENGQVSGYLEVFNPTTVPLQSRLTDIHQLDSINLEEFLGDKLTKIELSMSALENSDQSVVVVASENTSTPNLSARAVNYGTGSTLENNILAEEGSDEAPLPSSSSWSPAHKSTLNLSSGDGISWHGGATHQDDEIFGSSFNDKYEIFESQPSNQRLTFLSTDSLDSEKSKSAHKSGDQTDQGIQEGEDQALSYDTPQTYESANKKGAFASPSRGSLQASSGVSGLNSSPHETTKTSVRSRVDSSVVDGHMLSGGRLSDMSPSRDDMLAQQPLFENSHVSPYPLSSSLFVNESTNYRSTTLHEEVSHDKGEGSEPEKNSEHFMVSDESGGRGGGEGGIMMKNGVMEFDMGQRQDQVATRKASDFMERSRLRALEAKQTAQDKAAIKTLAKRLEPSSSSSLPQNESLQNLSADSFNELPKTGGGGKALVTRLAQGNGRTEKVSMKEARSRSSRLYKDLPEVAAARKKELEAKEKAERVAQAKADDKARRLHSAEKHRRLR